MQVAAHLETYLVAVRKRQAGVIADTLISGTDEPAANYSLR